MGSALALQDLETEIQAENGKRAHEIAHSLKGSCQMLGARRMGALCAELEGFAKAADFDGAAEILAALVAELGPVSSRLEKFKGSS